MGTCLYKNSTQHLQGSELKVEGIMSNVNALPNVREAEISITKKSINVRSLIRSKDSNDNDNGTCDQTLEFLKMGQHPSQECISNKKFTSGGSTSFKHPQKSDQDLYIAKDNHSIEKYKRQLPKSEEEDITLIPPINEMGPYHTDSHSMRYIDREISQEEEFHIRRSITSNFLFSDLTEEVMKLVLSDLILFQLEKGRMLFEEGTEGNYFYIVAKGSLEARSHGKMTRILHEWDCLGELSLLENCKREETIKCLSDVLVFILDGESFRDIQNRMNEIRLKERFNFLNSISIFKALDSICKMNVAEKIQKAEYIPCEKIISKGDIGDKLYIIKEGLVSCQNNRTEIRKLGNNEYFGENSILIETRRTLDVIALQRTVCYELSITDMKEALGENYKDTILFSLFKDFLSGHEYFKDIFIESQIMEIYKCFKIKCYVKNERIYNPDVGSNKRIIVVIAGSLVNVNTYEVFASRGGIVGEDVFKKLIDLPDDIMAFPDCIALEVELNNVYRVLNLDLTSNPLNVYKRINKLKQIYLFKHLSEKTTALIASTMKKEKYNPSQCIVEENTVGDTFYLISKGRVEIRINGKTIREFEKGNCFGEIAVFNANEKRTASVFAIDTVICYVLSKADFDLIITDQAIRDYLMKKIALQDTMINLSDLYFIKFLGKGKFGSVNMVHNHKNVYAIKAVSRSLADKHKFLAQYFIRERRVMLCLDHPFIVKMVKTLKNDNYCFFLLEFVNGENLDSYLNERSILKELGPTRFYMASILIMIEYLHNKLIAHRDFKPSNIMIDANGYLKLIDFGTAKMINDFTTTIVGTPHYISPEVLLGKGYSLSCDIWSAGVCLFELFYGKYPFGNCAHDVLDIYKDVLHSDIAFPTDHSRYPQVNSFIKELLHKKVNQRICSIPTLKTRPLFNDFNWDALIDFKIRPPYLPKTWNWSEQLSTLVSPFELVMQHEINKIKYKDYGGATPVEYDKTWANEF